MKLNWRHSFTHCAMVTVVVMLALPVAAADAPSPSKPIRLLVGCAPGSVADVTARFVAERLQDTLKQGMVVENEPGACGVIAARELVRASPDGCALMLAAMPQVSILPAANPRLPTTRSAISLRWRKRPRPTWCS